MPELQQDIRINDRYFLKRFIGSGSFGEVWLAHDEFLGMDVAVKVYISLDPRGVEEFKQEYRTAYGLSHENLLTATHFDVWEHCPYLVMKYCSNGSAANMVGDITDEKTMWKFIHDVAAGLAYLHRQEPEPIVHQDIKPDNILIDENARFLITDFGISKRIRSTMRKQSGRAITAGATSYMGPERFSKEPAPVKASDIWSLGVTIYELVTGELPFCGMGGSMLLNGAEIPDLDREWSRELNFVMQKCLAKETWDRPTAQKLVEISTSMLEGKTFLESKPAPTPPSTLKATDKPTDKPTAKPAKKEKTNNHFVRNASIALAVSVLLIALILSVIQYSDPVKTEAESNWAHYQMQVDSCRSFISVGESANTEALLKAKSYLASIQSQEQKYSDAMEGYSNYFTLYKSLQKKLDEAHEAWSKAADAQYKKVNNFPKAVEFYQLALKLKDDSTTKNAYLSMVDEHGNMIIKNMEFRNGNGSKTIDDYGSTLYASKIQYLHARITYEGLTDMEKPIKLSCKLINPYGNIVKGKDSPSGFSFEDEITVRKGNSNMAYLSGWGSDSGGTYVSGTYIYEIWYKGKKLFSKNIYIK